MNECLSSECPVCKKTRVYKTKTGYLQGLTKPCRSCANSLSSGGSGAKYVDGGANCSKCKQTLPFDKFYLKSGKPYSYCKLCHKEASLGYHKDTYRYSKYGLDKTDYEKMLETQKHKCGGCEQIMTSPCVDHCHTSGKVRGLLCRECNSALGLLKDSTRTLENLITYLNGAQEK